MDVESAWEDDEDDDDDERNPPSAAPGPTAMVQRTAALATTRESTSIVVHSSEDDSRIDEADEAQKELWMRAGAAMFADEGVVAPPTSWAPTMMRLNMKYENLSIVRGRDGAPLLLIYP